jgi:hypothetical protein
MGRVVLSRMMRIVEIGANTPAFDSSLTDMKTTAPLAAVDS